MQNKVFKFYTDAGHGWLAVKIADVFALGIQDKISAYSYMHGMTAYLEEDCDAAVFIQAYKDKYTNFHYQHKHIGDNGWIRYYDRWSLVSAENLVKL